MADLQVLSEEKESSIDEEKDSKIDAKPWLKERVIKPWLNTEIVNTKWIKAFGEEVNNKLAVVLPVIHVSNPMINGGKTAMGAIDRNIALIKKHKFNGCFVINHGFQPYLLVPIIIKIKDKYPDLWLGANFLGCIGDEFDFMKKYNLLNTLDGLWIDNGGIYYVKSSDDIKDLGASKRLNKYKKYKWNGLYFGGVDFKYQQQISKNNNNVDQYIKQCKNMSKYTSTRGYMDCICTTGKGTGKAADLDKMKAFKDGCIEGGGSKLSIASGVTPENVVSYLPFVDAILVATGISQDFNNFSDLKMKQMRSVIDQYYQKK